MDIWKGWGGWRLVAENPDDEPVLISPDGRTFGPDDIAGDYTQSDLSRALGRSRAAIAQRMKRGTLPDYDGFDDAGRGFWKYSTIKNLIQKEGAY